MPRLVDAADAFDESAIDPWDAPDEDDDESWTDWQIEGVAVEPADGGDAKSSLGVAAASITTAAAMARGRDSLSTGSVDTQSAHPVDKESRPLPPPRISPDVFKQGMTVTHPEYGPGKIVTLAGSGKNRRATIQFATVGQKKIILSHSLLRPAR